MTETVSTEIQCPNCGTPIDVNEALSHKRDQELRAEYEKRSTLQRQELQTQMQALELQQQQFAEQKLLQQQQVDDEVKQKLKIQREQIRQQLKQSMAEEQAEQLKSLQAELNEKSGKLKEYHQIKIDMERLKREKEELKSSIEADAERRLNEQLTIEKTKIQKAETLRSQMSLSEKENIIQQLKDQLDIAKRKAEQGSMQLQGEVQELAIEQWLVEQFPLDSIEEIKKGARGADCLQLVHSRSRKNCGSIYYESKRTQSFQIAWIEKFKMDIREKGADIGVLVTEAMPSDMSRMGIKDGIWICSFDEFKGLSLVLRDSIIRMSQAIAVQENKGDKMAMLYDFLTGNEFRMQVEAIVEGFTQMQDDLTKEKRAITGMWKKREKQIEKVLLNTTHMYSSIKGIAGSAVKSLALLDLELDEGE